MENDILHEAKRLRLLAAALELQHYTSTAANVVPIPGGDQVIAIGTPARVAELLQIGSAPDELIRIGGLMANIMFNLAQRGSNTVVSPETLKELQQQWDEARLDYRDATQKLLADQAPAQQQC